VGDFWTRGNTPKSFPFAGNNYLNPPSFVLTDVLELTSGDYPTRSQTAHGLVKHPPRGDAAAERAIF